MANTEKAQYKVLESFGKIELRLYEPMIVAECDVGGEQREARRSGFRILASYIFGNNGSNREVAMTVPVIQQLQGDKRWIIRFKMPALYKRVEDLPAPVDNRIKLAKIESTQFVVISFSGTTREQNLSKHYDQLIAFVKQKGIKTRGEPLYAFFNPPWTLPFLRHNEILLALSE